MFGRSILGLALACAAATSAAAAGSLQVSTNFPAPLTSVDPFQADLASLGVTFGLDSPATVSPSGPVTLEFRLLESDAGAGGYRVTSLDVGGSSFAVPLQAFVAGGTLLGSVVTGSGFDSLIGDHDTFGPNPAPFAFGAYDVYLSDADTSALTGIGPFVGDVDHLYFGVAGRALFEVAVAPGGSGCTFDAAGACTVGSGAPEPTGWALMIIGFGAAGAALRRGRRPTAA